MRPKGKIDWEFLCKALWFGLSVAVLLLGWGSCFADERCSDADAVFLPFMVVFSLPAGLIAFLFVYPLVESGTPVGYSLLWLSVFVAGYIQWSMISANIGRPQVLTLGLSDPHQKIQVASKEMPLSGQTTKRKLKIRRFKGHDRQNRTPLERAIGKTPSRFEITSSAFDETWQSSTHRLPSMACPPTCSDHREAKPRQAAVHDASLPKSRRAKDLQERLSRIVRR